MSLQNLNKKKLLEAAEFYGVDVADDATNQEIVQALIEEGVNDALYKKDFMKEEAPENVVTSKSVAPKKEEDVMTELDEVVEPRKEVYTPQQKLLIKMERKNPLFEFEKYRFTQERPFHVMPADVAERLLRSETGFRQAFPAEAEDFFS